MRLEEVTAEIRPRSDWEAVDLGFAMVRRDFWRCLCVWWLALLLPTLVAGWFLRGYPLILATLFWWWKPAASRMVLFELSRRLFGERPGWKSVFREIPRVWLRRFFYRFMLARFSPWLPVMLAVEDLEGLRGKPYRQRSSQLARRGDGAVMWLYFMGGGAVVWLSLSLFGMATMLLPDGQQGSWQAAWDSWDTSSPAEVPALIGWTIAIVWMVSISLVDLFVIGAGFGIYVNNRTWLEGWDVELAFKRLGQRLGKIAAVLLVAFSIFMPFMANAKEAAGSKPDSELMKEVKADPDFKVHTVTHKVLKEKPSSASKPVTRRSTPPAIHGDELMYIFGYTMGGCVLALLIWILWTYRHALKFWGDRGERRAAAPSARVVMGMEVTAESLPKDVPARAWALWQQGRHHEAIALLYRGTISKVIDVSRVEIQESDTEGDCLKRVETAGAPAFPDYFKGLTGVWIRLAYAGTEPPEIEVQTLCQDWPFAERRRA